MADSKNEKERTRSGWGQATAKALDVLAGIRMFFTEIKDSIAEHLDGILRRIEYLFLVYLWVSVGLLLMILGVFDLLIEFCRIPRGIVFSLGGLLIFLVAVIFLQAARIKKSRK